MNINKKDAEAKYYKYKGNIEFCIQPFKFSDLNLRDTNSVFDQFASCLISWKGLNEGDKPFECNDENKLYMYNHYSEVREFVFSKISSSQMHEE